MSAMMAVAMVVVFVYKIAGKGTSKGGGSSRQTRQEISPQLPFVL